MNSNVSGSGVEDDDDVKKMSERQTKAGNQECYLKLENLNT